VKRWLERELLDELAAEDPRALRSRGDLQRVNACMGNARSMAGALRAAFRERAPLRIVELGAGDGRFFLSVARRLAPGWPGVSTGLVDRQSIVSSGTSDALERLGWRAEALEADAFDWLRSPGVEPCDAIIANLFLHHFAEARLAELLHRAARLTRVFVAVEPRRSGWTLASGQLLRLIGCNEVTRHDALVSIRAGFAGRELSQLWPAMGNWSLHERAAGCWSHLFMAQRISPISPG
jgi:hypothetical protein